MKLTPADLLRAADGWRMRRGFGLTYRGRLADVLAAPNPSCALEMAEWAERYLCRPLEQLGRRGAVCPFMARALATQRFHMAFHSELDGRTPRLLKDALLSHCEDFLTMFPLESPDDAYQSLLLVFPSVPADHGWLMDDLHLEFKTHLMARGLMLAPMHPASTRGGYRNPLFPVFRAPRVCMAVRYMSEHDIVWVGHNRKAFAAYRRRFETTFTEGELSDALVPFYREALERLT